MPDALGAAGRWRNRGGVDSSEHEVAQRSAVGGVVYGAGKPGGPLIEAPLSAPGSAEGKTPRRVLGEGGLFKPFGKWRFPWHFAPIEKGLLTSTLRSSVGISIANSALSIKLGCAKKEK